MNSADQISALPLGPLTPLHGGLELHIVQHQNVGVDGLDRSWRPTFMLINFANAPEARTTFGSLNQAFGYSRHEFAGIDAVHELVRHVEESDHFIDGVVIYTGPQVGPSTDASMRELAGRIRSLCSGSVLTVGEWRWSKSSVHILGVPTTTPDTAIAVLQLLAARSAPPCLLSEFENEDVFEQQGSSRRHAVLAEAIWLRDTRELVYANAVVAVVVRQSPSIVAQFVAADLLPDELASVTAALTAGSTADWTFFCTESGDAFIAPCLPPQAVPITMIVYRPHLDALFSRPMRSRS